jgi:signal transduction histidine kinase
VGHLSEGEFKSWRQEDGTPGNDIAALWVDDEGVLWIGTGSRGLAKFDGRHWTHYTTRQGLASNSLGYLLGDGQGNLWIGSNAGIMRVPISDLNRVAEDGEGKISLRVYRRPDGLPTRESTEGSQPGAWREQGGRLWFSTIRGLASVDPYRLEPNPHPPPVVIESVEVDSVPQRTNLLQRAWQGPIVVPPGRERIGIRYTSLNLRAPDRARFRYRMKGHEAQWTEAGDSRVARYPKLPPGEYRFEVRASNEDGLWNLVGSALTFMVQPPFWRTWWFLSGSASLLLAGVVGLVYYLSTQRLQRQVERLRQQQALERERARIARDLHDQLGASLTQISLLGEMAEADRDLPNEVETHARQISQTSRDTTRVLDEIVWAVNPSNDTLDSLVTYFCKNAQEYLAVAGVRVRLEVPANLPALALPPEVRHNFFLAAKEAVTNVVRHAEASEARIRLSVDLRSFTLEIEDNGRGLGQLNPEKTARRNGLRNMRKRLEDVGGQFSLENGAGGGAVVRLTAPCRSFIPT